jgi:ATP-binding cassette, subfamily C, bacterial CydC
MIQRLLPYLWHHRGGFALAVLLAALTVAAGAGLMGTSGYLITRAAERPLITDLFMVTAAVRFFGISRAAVRYAERLTAHNLTFRILLSMRITLFRALEKLPLKVFMSRRPGDLLSGLHHDIDSLQHVYLRVITPAVAAFFLSWMTAGTLFLFEPLLAWVTLAFLLAHGITVPVLAVRLAKGRGRTEVRTKANLTAFVVDQMQGVKELHWMGATKNAETAFREMQGILDKDQRSNGGDAGLVEGVNNLLPQLAMLTILVVSVPLVMGGTLNSILIAALAFGVLASFEAIQGLGSAFLQWESYQEASGRIRAITQPRDYGLPTDPIPLPEKYGEIAFREVDFSYEEEHIVLQNINFTIQPDSKTALVGSSGCGKSTLVNLLLGMYKPDAGTITYAGNPISAYSANHYKALFGVVAQDGHIFNRPLRENLLLGNPDACDEMLSETLRTVGLKHLVGQLETEPGNLGMDLSGGERQRVLLARALLRDAPVWIFDEATAHLDIRTERNILNTLAALRGNRTLLLVTHRLIDMHTMDQILVMNRGEIVETGTHSSLLEAGGVYASLYHRQSEVLSVERR